MDRLLVGDVGYGKTEIAVRAAFKAVQSGRQVAVLVPTTILAEQHARTFSERLADFPVRIGDEPLPDGQGAGGRRCELADEDGSTSSSARTGCSAPTSSSSSSG
jgi:superfamily II DNA or RNA helicase